MKSDDRSAFRLSEKTLGRIINNNLLCSSLQPTMVRLLSQFISDVLAITQNLLRSHDSKLDIHMIVAEWWNRTMQACYSIIEKRFKAIISLAINPIFFCSVIVTN